ncbi:hypothetical protein THAR02_01215 [Trichoderma harzianum]|uniref:Transcription factor domain-containing protein n=1 Tax=Trichoderma harzianum TaxID=5544 RepID=A0A0F9XQ26_TRIHA|nr:hypothetical protein THAR02_01215 [Trichoderma harzianum]
MPTRRRRQGQGQARRVEELETKLDGLAAQLSLLTRAKETPTAPPDDSGVISASQPRPAELVSNINTSFHVSPPSASATTPWETASEDSPRDIVDHGLVHQQEAQEYLQEFRRGYLPHCPFVAMHPTLTADVIRKEFPTTFLAIMAVMKSSHPVIQKSLGDKLRLQIFTRVVLQGEASLDLLRGLLIFVAWHQYFHDAQNPQVFLSSQLCLTLVHKLGLEGKNASRLGVRSANREHGCDRGKPGGTCSSDEKRLLLGAYWLSTVVSKGLRKSCNMRFTRYMATCSQELTSHNEYETDKWIGPMIRVQNLYMKVSEIFGYFDASVIPVEGDAAIQCAVSSFCQELTSIKELFPFLAVEGSRLTEKAPMKITLLMGIKLVDYWSRELYSLQAWIYEIVFHDEAWIPDEMKQTDRAYSSNMANHVSHAPIIRIQMLWHLMGVNNCYFREFLALPGEELLRLSFLSYSRICYTLIGQAKITFALLNTVVNPPCNGMVQGVERQVPSAQVIVDKVNYDGHCMSLIEKFEKASRNLQKGEDKLQPFSMLSSVTKSMMFNYSRQLRDMLSNMSEEPVQVPWGTSKQHVDLGSLKAVSVDSGSAAVQDPEVVNGTHIGDWASLDMSSMDGVVGFDESMWETMLSEFTLPSGNYTSTNRPI